MVSKRKKICSYIFFFFMHTSKASYRFGDDVGTVS